MEMWKCVRVLVFGLVCLGGVEAAGTDSSGIEFFESRIRPVLVQDCYDCHSTATKQKGGLNLDHRLGWQAGGDSGPVIVPGHPEESLLIRSIRHEEPDLQMPKSGAKLDDAILEDFAEWVRMGAPDPRDEPPSAEQVAADRDWGAVMERRKKWWSFQPITRPEVPAGEWSDHVVDRFIEAGWQERGLRPVGAAVPGVLVRRLFLTLIGLPPTPEQVEEFEAAYAADTEGAVGRLVDALLASPHFGERWARHWMDWIRYAESHGSEGDPAIVNAHLYRDYLIRALNEDVPYDQLVREHIAGDLLETPRINEELGIQESLVGTAHWRMVFHGFAPTDALDERVRFTDDQINVFSKAFLGLTVSCARCHHHKFDAISQEDYYALAGILGSTRPSRRAIDVEECQAGVGEAMVEIGGEVRAVVAGEWLRQLAGLRERLIEPEVLGVAAGSGSHLLYPLWFLAEAEDAEAALARLRAGWEADDAAWQGHLEHEYGLRWNLAGEGDYRLWFREGAGLGSVPVRAGAFSVSPEGEQVISGIFPGGVYTHLRSTKQGGLLTSPDFQLEGDYELWLRVRGDGGAMARYVVQNYPRDGTVYPVHRMGSDEAGWHWKQFDLAYWRGDDVHIELATAADAPLLASGEARSWFGIREAVLVEKGTMTPPREPRRYLAPVLGRAGSVHSLGEMVEVYIRAIELAIRAWQSDSLSDDEAELLEECRRLGLLPNRLDRLAGAGELMGRYRELEGGIAVAQRVPALAEWRGRDQALYDRGNHKVPLDRVPRRFLEAIDASPYQTEWSGRRELAEDVLREDNPFTRRVIVNRVWHHLFGRGIVATPDNFGRLGALPTHPALLDHLASYFSEEAGWSLKALIRHVVSSRTWQLGSVPSAEAEQLDPENEGLSHFSVRRLEAEAIRDSVLQASGRLEPAMYGRAVDGRQPRRSVYVNVIRNRPDPFLAVFDAPLPFSAQGRRSVTTVPAQSLAMMNGEFVLESARAWGGALSRWSQEVGRSEVIDSVWRAAFARHPSSQETEQVLAFMDSQLAAYEEVVRALERERGELVEVELKLERLLELGRSRVGTGREAGLVDGAFLKPVSQWLFELDGGDSVGSLDLTLRGGARVEDGALVLGGGDSFAVSSSIQQDLRAKSMEVWVQLADYEQRGGGAMSIQTLDGAVFDAVVFGEQEARRWMAGSDVFRRTQSFAGPAEEDAVEAPVHIVITYGADGEVTAYRNGEVYGRAYRVGSPVSFKRGEAELLFGLRHGGASAGRLLSGRIHEARLYDRVLSAEEVLAAANRDTGYVSRSSLLGALSAEERQEWDEGVSRRERLGESIRELEAGVGGEAAEEVWNDLALAIFNMKEFIYVR